MAKTDSNPGIDPNCPIGMERGNHRAGIKGCTCKKATRSKTVKDTTTDTNERPPLVKGSKTRCGRCLYFRSMHPKTLGDCQDVYGVKKSSRACQQFELDIRPSYYQGNPDVSRYNEVAQDRYAEVPVLMEEVKELAGAIFSKSQIRSGKKDQLRRVKEVLRKQNDTSALIPFLEEVQANRDRVSEVQSLAIMWHGEIEEMYSEAESFLITRFPELRTVKPEAVRKSIIQSILTNVQQAQSRIKALHDQCDQALRNFAAQHNALIEIQVSARTPVTIPQYAISDLHEKGKSPIRRKNRRERTR